MAGRGRRRRGCSQPRPSRRVLGPRLPGARCFAAEIRRRASGSRPHPELGASGLRGDGALRRGRSGGGLGQQRGCPVLTLTRQQRFSPAKKKAERNGPTPRLESTQSSFSPGACCISSELQRKTACVSHPIPSMGCFAACLFCSSVQNP